MDSNGIVAGLMFTRIVFIFVLWGMTNLLFFRKLYEVLPTGLCQMRNDMIERGDRGRHGEYQNQILLS